MNQRRLRANQHIRDLASEVTLSHKEMIQPLFIDQELSKPVPNQFMSGVYTDTIESVLHQIESDLKNGTNKFLLFPVPEHKAEKDFNFDFAASVIAHIKKRFGDDVWLAPDLCLCSYTTHGHCGVLDATKSRMLDDETVVILSRYALQLAQSGADCIAPSDMTDGRIKGIRTILDQNGLDTTSIMSYSSKFSSGYYGPFRDVCKSAPDKTIKIQNRSTYQIDYRNGSDAIASSLRDIQEGADIIMVKPCIPYLDIVTKLHQQVKVPIAVYHVSGEYAGFELLVKNNLMDRTQGLIEIWTACKRAGAGIIITYAAREAKRIING